MQKNAFQNFEPILTYLSNVSQVDNIFDFDHKYLMGSFLKMMNIIRKIEGHLGTILVSIYTYET